MEQEKKNKHKNSQIYFVFCLFFFCYQKSITHSTVNLHRKNNINFRKTHKAPKGIKKYIKKWGKNTSLQLCCCCCVCFWNFSLNCINKNSNNSSAHLTQNKNGKRMKSRSLLCIVCSRKHILYCFCYNQEIGILLIIKF